MLLGGRPDIIPISLRLCHLQVSTKTKRAPQAVSDARLDGIKIFADKTPARDVQSNGQQLAWAPRHWQIVDVRRGSLHVFAVALEMLQ